MTTTRVVEYGDITLHLTDQQYAALVRATHDDPPLAILMARALALCELLDVELMPWQIRALAGILVEPNVSPTDDTIHTERVTHQ